MASKQELESYLKNKKAGFIQFGKAYRDRIYLTSSDIKKLRLNGSVMVSGLSPADIRMVKNAHKKIGKTWSPSKKRKVYSKHGVLKVRA